MTEFDPKQALGRIHWFANFNTFGLRSKREVAADRTIRA
jgi:hypothetical protein